MIRFFFCLSIFLFFFLLTNCAVHSPVSDNSQKDEVIAYRLVEPLFNINQMSKVLRKEIGNETTQDVFEIEGVCVGCHAYSSQGHVALNVKKKGDRRLVIFNTDSDGLHLFDTKKIGEFSFLAWSPDARYLAIAVNTFGVIDIKNDVIEPFNLRYQSGDLAFYDMATKEINLLPGASEMDFVEDMPFWSPDGKELLFVKYKSEKDAPIESMSIYRIPFNNGVGGTPEPVVIASGAGDYNYFPAYSPDGRWISFVKGEGSKGVFARKTSDIYLLPRTGGTPKKLSLNTEGIMDSWHRWSKDGRVIVFSSKRGGDMTALYGSTVDANGNTSRPVKVAGHDKVKVNIPEFVPTQNIQRDEKSAFKDAIDKIYIESK
jgi:dipeptidyl aminopeptidase/acylaminoacyl peptidase